MNNYRDILDEIAINLGFEKEIEKYTPEITTAINWAEQKMLSKSRGVKIYERISIKSTQTEYQLPPDFYADNKVIITDKTLQLFRTKELEFEQLIAYTAVPTPQSLMVGPDMVSYQYIVNSTIQTEQQAMYSGYVLWALKRVADGYEIVIKPALDGYIYIYYSLMSPVPKDFLRAHPSSPERFWHGIISGSTWYLLRRKALTVSQLDANKGAVFMRAAFEFKADFLEDVSELAALQTERSEPFVLKPFSMGYIPEEDL